MKKILLILSAAVSMFLISCTDDLNLKFKTDGSVDMSFSANAGTALTQMLQGFAMSTGSSTVIDTKAISKELSSNGFSNVKVTPKGLAGFTASATDKNRTTPVFSSGLVKVTEDSNKNTKIKAEITPAQLKDLYDTSDEQTQMLLDLLLAPVFNGEEMTEEEYVDLISSFYGAPVGQEIKASKVNISIEDQAGKKVTKIVPLVKILTMKDPLIIEN